MKKRLCAWLLAAAMLLQIMPVGAVTVYAEGPAPQGGAVYVKADGDDATGNGSSEKPYATLAEAVDKAEDGDTIYVMSDLEMTKTARFWDKHLTIQSFGDNAYTITRGDNFEQEQDNARSTYNPAMVEVQTTSSEAGLTLKNIVFDDAGKHAGTKFSQAVSKSDSEDNTIGNSACVQDAIIASNATQSCTITLGDGAVLKNFGGMSAVRVTSAARLVMESGSMICDDTVTDRSKGDEGSNGPAGAVWIQSGSFEMEAGAKITNVVGRAVYADGGSATINGTISNITNDPDMWQGDSSGLALHLRGGAEAVLGATGRIENISGTHAGYKGAIVNNGGKFVTEIGSVISDVTSTPAIYSNYGTDMLNGVIENCSNDFIIGGFANNTTIDTNGVIQNCTASNGAANAVVYTSNASKITLNGTVKDNNASYGFYIINQSGGGASLVMNDGAVLSGNGKNTGVYVNASESSFTMNGGTISNFATGVYCRGKNGRDATFIMNDGTIKENTSYGLNYEIYEGSESVVQLNGGTITDNGTDYQIYATGGAACDAYEYIKVTEGVVRDNTTVNLSFGKVTLDDDYGTVWLGRAANADVKTTIEAKATEKDGTLIWTAQGNALYIKPENAGDYHFTATRTSAASKNDLYIGYIPIDENGAPEPDGELALIEFEYNTSTVDVTMEGLEANQAYAVMFVNSDVPVTICTVTFDLDGGEFGGLLPTIITPNPAEVNMGDQLSSNYFDTSRLVPPESEPLMDFMGWYRVLEDGTLSDTAWKQTDPVMEDMTLKAKWGVMVDYAVEHYTADANSETGYILAEREELKGEAGTEVTAKPKEYPGFTYNAEKSTSTATLEAFEGEEEMVVLKLYYDVASTPVEPEKGDSDGNLEALIGAGVVLAGGAAALAYLYRDALPIWLFTGVVKLDDEDGTPVPNATVTLYQDGEEVKSVTTNDDGYFTTRVPKGDYEVVVTWERDGVQYTTTTQATVDRVAGDIRPQEIILALDQLPEGMLP